MKIPEKFEIGGQTVKILVKDKDDSGDNRFGYYDSTKEEIVIFKKLDSEDEVVELTEDQINNTFWHEIKGLLV